MSAPRHVAIIGLGLIGGSVARRLHNDGVEVSGVDIDATTRSAAAADGIATYASTGEVPSAPQIALVAVPPAHTCAAVLDALQRWPEALVSDAASVKASVIPDEHSASADQLARYLPGHPLAGSESAGYAAGHADAFDGAVWALCPGPSTPVELAAGVGPLLDALGAHALVCSPEAHDRAVARTSHLPHAVAIALAWAGVSDSDAAAGPLAATLSGGALRDGTRVAAAGIELWWDILTANREPALEAIDDFQLKLTELKGAIATGDRDRASEIWACGQRAQRLIAASRWSEREFTAVREPLSAGWEPWLALGAAGTVLRKLHLDGEHLSAEASAPSLAP